MTSQTGKIYGRILSIWIFLFFILRASLGGAHKFYFRLRNVRDNGHDTEKVSKCIGDSVVGERLFLKTAFLHYG